MAMRMRNLICSVVLATFVASLSWALRLLSQSLDFSSFMVFGVVTITIMVSLGFAWDRYERNRGFE
jgi:hypothetical protein